MRLDIPFGSLQDGFVDARLERLFVDSLFILLLMGGLAQAESFLAVQNHPLFFPASLLVTNGAPDLTNPPARLMVSAVSANSTTGGSVSLVNTQVWARYYGTNILGLHQAIRIVLGDAGSVVVAGPSAGDYATVKYSADGTALWTNRYAGPESYNNQVSDLALDGLGNVYVTGYSQYTNGVSDAATIKYAPNGTPLWTNWSAGDLPPAVVADAAGNSYLLVWNYFMTSGVPASTLIKYDPAGNLLWARRYNDPANIEDVPVALAWSPSGDLFVAITSDDAYTGQNYTVLKYTTDGVCLWTNHYDRRFSDMPTSLTVDRSGNVIVTGDSLDPAPHLYATIKYSGDGQALWTNLLTGPQYQGGAVPQVVSDLAGNSFVAGGAPGATGTGDYVLLKFDPNGVPLWTNRYIGLGATNGILSQTATDSAGSLYTAGSTRPPGGTLDECVLAKYAADGTPMWTNHFDGPPGAAAYGFAFALSPSGDIHVTGQVTFGNRYQFATVKFADYVLYTPPPNFSGADSFTFTVTDSAGNRVTNAVSVTILAPAMTLQPISWNSSGGFSLRVTGALDQAPVVLFASTDLVHWNAVATNSTVGGACEFHDAAAAGSSRRFYRAGQ